ncbi:hypothetical protein DOTSEDRAFT_131105 [Dothistroma septosporum NZE10]|uniref:F-box domain-containing protein n=1 Tax=Dothistroma septosporum (strain NZE10 / CBS 128990) TaxID=675120 RepID=N1PKQ5_DOTSN|nr:hypothetical protein DOTSEDRAFT_131105 [Dothistroma septosporum NZE10]
MANVETVSRGLFSLPNEILLNILNLFSTRDLLDISSSCHQIHSLVVRIVRHRLQIAAELDGHTLYLECGPPSAKWTTSKVFCTELGTGGLEELVSDIQEHGGQVGHIGLMSELYTRFRPVNKSPDFRTVPRPHLAGDVPGSATFMTPEARAAAWKGDGSDAVTRTIAIDANFLFSQLETVSYLGKREATRGLLFSIQEVCDGTIRVWRDWLSKNCESKRWSNGEPIAVHHDGQDLEATGKGRSASVASVYGDPRKDPRILWINSGVECVGIKFRVKEQKWQRDNPVLFASESEVPISYHVELEEIVIRTTHLLLKVEEARKQILNQTGKAMIFGSYTE